MRVSERPAVKSAVISDLSLRRFQEFGFVFSTAKYSFRPGDSTVDRKRENRQLETGMLTAANWKYGFYGSELSANTLNKRQVYKGRVQRANT